MEVKNTHINVAGHFFNKKIEPTNLREKFIFALFQIVAEQGADALTASALVTSTQSSKGALFHHFKTLDDLCISCLHFFKSFVHDSIQVGQTENLLEYLYAFAKDEKARKFNSAYFHLAHFFRDRAIRSPDFRKVLKDSTEIFSNRSAELAMVHIKNKADFESVKSIMTLFSFGLEKIYFHGLIHQNAEMTEKMSHLLIESTYSELKKLSLTAKIA